MILELVSIFRVQKSKSTWQSFATPSILKQRAIFLKEIRAFFDSRDLIEVDTPLLMHGVNSDPFIRAFQLEDRFLQTSPEFAMKRLLAQGMSSIYYLGKAFRKDEAGRLHNPEFTILEWYRVGWGLEALIKEIESLFQHLLDAPSKTVVTYTELFEPLGIDPHSADCEQLISVAKAYTNNIDIMLDSDRVGLLDWLFMLAIEPNLDPDALTIITEYPIDCAQLSNYMPHPTHQQVAQRFEVFYQGFELANGYDELTSAIEQRKRFISDQKKRQELSLDTVPIDEDLLAALDAGLPQSSGVAVGVDRMLMIKTGAKHIREVLPFCWAHS